MALNENSPRFNWQPADSDITLALHQQATIQKCFEIESKYNTVIIRDPPGAGKTFTVLGYLRALKENQNPTYNADEFSEFASSDISKLDEISKIDTSDIILENRPIEVREKISKFQDLLGQDIHEMKEREIALQTILDDPANTMNDHQVNLKLNEIENCKMRIQNINGAINQISSYADKDRKSTSLDAIRKKKVINHSITLIVLPPNIHTQWMNEIARFGGLTAFSYCEFQDITKLYGDPSAIIFDYDILLTNSIYYNLIASVSSQLGIVFDRIIIDEIDSISNDSNILFGKTDKYGVLSSPQGQTTNDMTGYSGFTGINTKKCDEINVIKRWFISASINLSTILINRIDNNIKGVLVCKNNIKDYYNFNYNQTRKCNYCEQSFYISLSEENMTMDDVLILVKNIDICTTPEFIASSFILPPIVERVYRINNKIIDNILSTILDKGQMMKLNAHDYASLKLKYNMEIANSMSEVANIIRKDLVAGIESTESQLNSIAKNIESCNESDISKLNELKKEYYKCKEANDQIKLSLQQYSERVHENNMCPICLDVLTSRVVMKCCGNSFCEGCIFKILTDKNGHAKCAMCRADYQIKDILIIPDSNINLEIANIDADNNIARANFFKPGIHEICKSDYEKYFGIDVEINKGIDKIDIMFKLLDYIFGSNSVARKIMIFSNSANWLYDKIKGVYPEIEIENLARCGNIKDINTVVKKYKYGYTTILLNEPRMYGCGMNFENTTDLILMHNVNEIGQVIGRAQRYGRTTPLNLWRIQYENEYKNNVN